MKDTLDPFRVLVGVLASEKEVDHLVAASNIAGLTVDLSLSERDEGSRIQRIRALQPRILAAYDSLDDEARLVAAQAAIVHLGPQASQLLDRVRTALEAVGWVIQNGTLTPVDLDLREMFFPKGSQWDAFVVIRDVFHRAQQSITIVDPYANGTIFQLLARDGGVPLRVRVLCSKYAAAVAAEATTFSAQHPGTTVELRSTRKEFHDRFIMVDEDEYVHLGASIKDAGNTAFMISAIEDETNKVALVSAFNNAWEAAQVVT